MVWYTKRGPIGTIRGILIGQDFRCHNIEDEQMAKDYQEIFLIWLKMQIPSLECYEIISRRPFSVITYMSVIEMTLQQ